MDETTMAQFDAGAAPPALAQYPDLSAAAHVGPVDRQPHHRHSPEPRRCRPGGLAERRGRWAQTYGVVHSAIGSWAGQVVLFGCTFAFFLHLCGGIRHLVWDTVHGFELRSIYISGWTVVATSVALTVAAWVASLFVGGWP